jgi:hypothetical protein
LKSQKNSKAIRIEGVVALAIGDMAMKKAEIKLNFKKKYLTEHKYSNKKF